MSAESMERCSHCDTRVTDDTRFFHNGFYFCAECCSALISWLLDGGVEDSPELFGYVYGWRVESETTT